MGLEGTGEVHGVSSDWEAIVSSMLASPPVGGSERARVRGAVEGSLTWGFGRVEVDADIRVDREWLW